MEQHIRFCTTADGVRLAYALAGQGPPLVKTANWLNHLEYDWESPIWRHILEALTDRHLLVRYDERGNGMSDWDVAELSLDAFVRDLETVVDTVGLERFSLFGISQGCAVSVAYAVRHPERVERLVLHGGFARGWLAHHDADGGARHRATLTLIRQGWGRENPALRQMFTSMFLPAGTPEEMRWFNELQRRSTSPENAARLYEAFGRLDVVDLLPRLSVPTLVLHSVGDAQIPFSAGEAMARLIPGARLVPLVSDNHLVLEHDPAWPEFRRVILEFLGTADGAEAAAFPAPLARDADELAEADRLFDRALDVAPAERDAWLVRACGGRPDLLARVRRLLDAAADDDYATGGALAGGFGRRISDEITRDAPEAGLAPGERLGPYEIAGEIGRGAAGAVYRARHARLGRDVAIKALADARLDEPALRAFEREARLLAGLSHPNLATVHDLLLVAGRPYLVLELVDGPTLDERLADAAGPLPVSEIVTTARGIAAGLAEAHRRGVIHRDLKPANVKIAATGQPKILDFGLAKVVAGDAAAVDDALRTHDGLVRGTPGYMSPEQARGEPVDARTDVWAFGCVLYEMATGRRAFPGRSAGDVLAAVLRDDVDWSAWPDAAPPELRELAERCLVKDRDGRRVTMDEAHGVLGALAGTG